MTLDVGYDSIRHLMSELIPGQNTVSCSVLALANCHVSFMYCLEDLIASWWRNNESFTSKDEAVFNCEGVFVTMVLA